MSMFPQSGSQRLELNYGTTERTMFNFFNAVYAWMAVGLALTAAVGYGVSQSRTMLQLVYGSHALIVVCFLGLAVFSIAIQRMVLKINPTVSTLLFLLYAALLGVLLSGIFLTYKVETLLASFFVTGGVFAGMSIYGYVAKRDLTTIGSYCIMGLWGMFLASMVNVFVANSTLGWIVTYGVLFVTIGIIAYETQKLRVLASRFEGNRDMLARLSIMGALVLYISFINLFLSVLRIMGNRR